jgi:hypothetical protein
MWKGGEEKCCGKGYKKVPHIMDMKDKIGGITIKMSSIMDMKDK